MKDGNDQVGGRHNANHKNQDMVGSVEGFGCNGYAS